MNALTIPFTCAVALATMAGAGMHHWLQVRAQVTGRAPLPIAAEISPSAPAASTSPDHSAEESADSTPESAATPTTGLDPNLIARLERVIAGQEKIMARFAEMDQRNLNLRDQIAETNRDLMELQFRVDSHSESFRPLRATQANALVPEASSVLPPRE